MSESFNNGRLIPTRQRRLHTSQQRSGSFSSHYPVFDLISKQNQKSDASRLVNHQQPAHIKCARQPRLCERVKKRYHRNSKRGKSNSSKLRQNIKIPSNQLQLNNDLKPHVSRNKR